MKKLNVFWILIDSARNFESNLDDRGLPKSVADFSKDAIFFKNTVTSAPSTLMSISSMMTVKPSYLLSRSYENFPGIIEDPSFPKLLRREGYDVFGAIYFKHGREVLSSLFGFLKSKFLPKDLTHRKDVWTNNDVFGVFKKIISRHNWKKPTFCYLHYNVRVDDNISNVIEKTLEEIKSKGLYEKSIIIINSDHGYPMPDRGWDAEYEKKRGWGHDKLMYNDNILTPLVIKYPNSKKIFSEKYISTLDIVPTITNILEIDYDWGEFGIDLLKNNKRNNIIRTDNRYVGQAPSHSAIVEDGMKLIVNINKEEKIEYEFYDLMNDDKEINNLFLSDERKDEVSVFIKKYEKSNYSFLNYHQKFLLDKWKDNIQVDKFYDKSTISVVIPWNSSKLIKKAKLFSTKDIVYLDNNGLCFKKNIYYSLYRNYFLKRKIIFKNDKFALIDIIKRVIFKKVLKPIK